MFKPVIAFAMFVSIGLATAAMASAGQLGIQGFKSYPVQTWKEPPAGAMRTMKDTRLSEADIGDIEAIRIVVFRPRLDLIGLYAGGQVIYVKSGDVEANDPQYVRTQMGSNLDCTPATYSGASGGMSENNVSGTSLGFGGC